MPFALEAIEEGCSVNVAADKGDTTFCEEAKDLTPPAFLGALQKNNNMKREILFSEIMSVVAPLPPTRCTTQNQLT